MGGVLDYYNISAKDCLNINRDVWKEKFNLKIKDDLLELLKIYLDNNKSPSISMIKNMLSKEVRKKINADLDELWLDYKFEFKNLNRRLKLGKLFDNNHFYIFDEDIKYFFDLEEDLVGQNVYVVYNRGGNIFRKLFSLDFSIFKNYKIYSLISFDNDD
ncbi:hypothetical protein RQ87_19685, partial [Acinetobacter baumannii]